MSVDANTWIPDHQLDNVSSLGFVNQLITEVLDSYFAYIDGDGPIRLEPVTDERREYVTVKGVKPVPTALSRRAATVIEDLRAVLEHVLMAELEATLGRPMTSKEEKAIELPHFATREALIRWSKDKRRSTLHQLHEGSPFFDRIDKLQPYNRTARPDLHPLHLLADLSNESKHRRPLKIGVLLGHSFAENGHPDFESGTQITAPLQPGDVVGSSPLRTKLVAAIYPNVCIRLPGTEKWSNLVSLLRDIESWTRTIAVPTLVVGTHENLPPISAGIDVSHGYDDVRLAIASADPQSAVEVSQGRIMIESMRRSLPELLMAMPAHPSRDVILPYVDSLEDGKVQEIVMTITSLRTEPYALMSYCAQIGDEIRASFSG